LAQRVVFLLSGSHHRSDVVDQKMTKFRRDIGNVSGNDLKEFCRF
jgi:hypothetical protein